MEDAASQAVILDAGVLAQAAQTVAAVQRQAGDGVGVAARAPRQAFEEEAQAPRPLPPVGVRPEQQRRILAAQPFEQLQRRARIGPRLGVADRDLAAVGEAGLQAGARLAVEHRDGVAFLAQIPGAEGAREPGTEDDDMHEGKWRYPEDSHSIKPARARPLHDKHGTRIIRATAFFGSRGSRMRRLTLMQYLSEQQRRQQGINADLGGETPEPLSAQRSQRHKEHEEGPENSRRSRTCAQLDRKASSDSSLVDFVSL